MTGLYLSLTGLSPFIASFSDTVQLDKNLVTVWKLRRFPNSVLQPQFYATPACLHVDDLGSSPFAHHYSGYLFDFFYVRLLRCFTSPTAPPITGFLVFTRKVAPFGYLRIDNCLRFPVTFRRLLRPSSLSDAMASPICPCTS